MSVTLSGPKGSVTAELGPTLPTFTDGVGGWQEVTRPRRMSMTEWRGPAPMKATVQLLFDGYADDRSVEADVAAVSAKLAPAVDEQEPPRFTVVGAWPIPAGVEWVCQAITQDDYIRAKDGTAVRAFLTLSLLQYVPGDVVTKPTTATQRATSAAGTAAGKAGSAATKTYAVKAGDTLPSIAAAKLGNYRRFPEIATLNGLSDPNRLTVGQKLRLP